MESKLKWVVYYHSINRGKIETFNIFDHWKFNDDTQKNLKKIKDKDEFAKKLKSDLMYYFWSKCEYEVIITSFPTYIKMDELDRLNEERESCKEKNNRDPKILGANLETEIKIDIYEQVMNNWDIFLDYVWNSKQHRTTKNAGRGYVKATGKCPMCEDCPDNCPIDKD